VQLEIAAEAIAQFYCHCDDCQAVTGGAFVPLALFPKNAVRIEGEATFTWTYKTLPRTRCSKCGTFLYGEPPGMGVLGVSGSLIPPDRFRPTFHNQCRFAVMPVRDNLPHFTSAPKMFGGSDETEEW
jgi:hypothetical protein